MGKGRIRGKIPGPGPSTGPVVKLSSVLFVAAAAIAGSLATFGSRQASEEPRTQTSYYANGQLETECELKDGRREGACRRFYADGSKLAEGRFEDGKMQGEWTFWRRDGQLDAERSGTFEDGEKIRP